MPIQFQFLVRKASLHFHWDVPDYWAENILTGIVERIDLILSFNKKHAEKLKAIFRPLDFVHDLTPGDLPTDRILNVYESEVKQELRDMGCVPITEFEDDPPESGEPV